MIEMDNRLNDLSTKEKKVEKRPWWKKWWVIVIFLIVAFIVGSFIFAFLSAWRNVKQGNIPPEIREELLRGGKFTTLDKGGDLVGSKDANWEFLYTGDDPSLGNPDAPIKIVEFSDFQCPFCREAYPIIKELLEKYSDQVYFIYRDFPIDAIHPQARLAAEAGECAQDQKLFWPLHDKMFDNQNRLSLSNILQYASEVGIEMNKFADCLSSKKYSKEVEQDLQDGILAGVDGTPTFFVNGNKIEGVITLSVWDKIITSLIANNKGQTR